jgi:haloalkane dehalogenase
VAGTLAPKLTPEEMDHYRKAQPGSQARRGVVEMPRQILAARPLLEQLSRQVPERLGDKPALLAWACKTSGSGPSPSCPGCARRSHHEVVELPRAKHYLPEDARDDIAAAIVGRFSPRIRIDPRLDRARCVFSRGCRPAGAGIKGGGAA